MQLEKFDVCYLLRYTHEYRYCDVSVTVFEVVGWRYCYRGGGGRAATAYTQAVGGANYVHTNVSYCCIGWCSL